MSTTDGFVSTAPAWEADYWCSHGSGRHRVGRGGFCGCVHVQTRLGSEVIPIALTVGPDAQLNEVWVPDFGESAKAVFWAQCLRDVWAYRQCFHRWGRANGSADNSVRINMHKSGQVTPQSMRPDGQRLRRNMQGSFSSRSAPVLPSSQIQTISGGGLPLQQLGSTSLPSRAVTPTEQRVYPKFIVREL